MNSQLDVVHVAVAVILNEQGQVLLSRRPEHVHQGGLWEFPGGKLEPHETVAEALRRELDEELGIHVRAARPLIKIRHRYSDCEVLLDVHRVERFDGVPHGCEGQTVSWYEQDALRTLSMPAANKPIVQSVLLPDRYLITPSSSNHSAEFLGQVERCLKSGIRLIQFRDVNVTDVHYLHTAQSISHLAQAYQASLMLNRTPQLVQQCPGAGLHLNSERLMHCTSRPVGADTYLSASCHNEKELEQANRIGVDFIVVSPVKPTLSHPDAMPLGWERFLSLTALASMPVYALGGLVESDIDPAQHYGGQGIAAIRGLWL